MRHSPIHGSGLQNLAHAPSRYSQTSYESWKIMQCTTREEIESNQVAMSIFNIVTIAVSEAGQVMIKNKGDVNEYVNESLNENSIWENYNAMYKLPGRNNKTIMLKIAKEFFALRQKMRKAGERGNMDEHEEYHELIKKKVNNFIRWVTGAPGGTEIWL